MHPRCPPIITPLATKNIVAQSSAFLRKAADSVLLVFGPSHCTVFSTAVGCSSTQEVPTTVHSIHTPQKRARRSSFQPQSQSNPSSVVGMADTHDLLRKQQQQSECANLHGLVERLACFMKKWIDMRVPTEGRTSFFFPHLLISMPFPTLVPSSIDVTVFLLTNPFLCSLPLSLPPTWQPLSLKHLPERTIFVPFAARVDCQKLGVPLVENNKRQRTCPSNRAPPPLLPKHLRRLASLFP